jgi:hypothetical protein
MLVLISSFIFFIYLYQRKMFRKKKAFEEIERLFKNLELQSAYQVIQGQDEERKKIAADVHDNLGSMIATLVMYNEQIAKQPSMDDTHRLNLLSRKILNNLGTDVRKIVNSLDSGALRDFGLASALNQLCETIANTQKVKLTSVVDVENSIKAENSFHLYRITQELFTNTLKHSQATEVRFEITQINNEITIIYEDNGVGFDPVLKNGKSMGLQNIQSRVNHLQGELKIKSSPSNGSTFIIEIPAQHGN